MTVKKVDAHLNKFTADFTGLSTDTKPTDCGAGSTFWEVDVKAGYIFDGAVWWPV